MKFFKEIDLYYIITLLFLLLSANASVMSTNDIIWFIVMFFMFMVAVVQKKLQPADYKVIASFSFIYLAFYIARDVLINNLDLPFIFSDVIYLFKFIFITFIYCNILKEKIASYVIKVIIHLTILSFGFYFFQLLGLGDYIYKFSMALNLRSKTDFDGYTNFIIYTFIKQSEFRNAGFVWEPGSFGCFLMIALIFNFFLNDFTFDKRSKILIVGILTTLSTTDYLSLLLLLFCRYRIKVPKINLGAILIVVTSIIIIMYLPFLGDKISNTYQNDMVDLKRLNYLEAFYRHSNSQIPLNRFSSMAFLYDTFGIKLILGVSNKYDVISSTLSIVNISNGLFDFFSRFGLIAFIYMIYKYSQFCLTYIFKIEYLIYFIIIFLILGFGEPVLVLPFFLMFLFIDNKQVNLLKNKARRVKFSDLNLPPLPQKNGAI